MIVLIPIGFLIVSVRMRVWMCVCARARCGIKSSAAPESDVQESADRMSAATGVNGLVSFRPALSSFFLQPRLCSRGLDGGGEATALVASDALQTASTITALSAQVMNIDSWMRSKSSCHRADTDREEDGSCSRQKLTPQPL